jgi:uncharacterized membrane protein YcgQ (UPF0703/DUF1980 family)
MKRAFWGLLCCALLLGGCGKPGDSMVEIKEKMFIAQISDVYINLKDYTGKKIKYEGIMGYAREEKTGKPLYWVFRKTPGCCGNDGTAGLEVAWEGEYPPQDTWVEVVGTVEALQIEAEGKLSRSPLVRLSALTKPSKEGERFVVK